MPFVGRDRSIVPSSTSNLGESQLDTPDLSLVAETIFTDNLQFGIAEEKLDEGTTDISRDKLLLSGQDGHTDEPTRRLIQKLAITAVDLCLKAMQLTSTRDLVGL